MQLERCRECGIVAALAVTTHGDVCLVLGGVRFGRVVGEVWPTRLPRSGRPPMLAA